MDGYISTKGRCECGGTFKYNERKGDLFCIECGNRGHAPYIVRMGRENYKSCRSPREAEQHLNHIRCQKGKPDIYGRYDPRDWKRDNPNGLKKLGESWIEKKVATRPELTPTRMSDIRNAISRFIEFMGDKNIKLIDEQDLSGFAAHDHKDLRYNERLLSSKTVYDICQTLNEFLGWAAKVAKCEPIKFSGLGYDYHETEPITMQQQQAILDWLSENCPEPRIIFAIATLCRNPNVRPGELVEVQWRHVDLISGIIYIRKRKSRRKLKRAALKPKKIFVTQEQLNMLKKLFLDQYTDLNEFLFIHTVKRSGVIPGSRIHSKVLNTWFKRAGKAIGVDTYLYAGTKHTTTTALRQEYDRQAVMEHGTGHRSEAFGHYDHSDGTREAKEMREAYDKMRLRIVGRD